MFGKMVKDRRRKTASSSEHSATTQDLVKTSELVSKPSFTAKLYGSEGRTIFFAMGIIFLIGLSVCYWSESQATRPWPSWGWISPWVAWRQGSPLRHCPVRHVHHHYHLFYYCTVNNMHDTLTPLGGMIPCCT